MNQIGNGSQSYRLSGGHQAAPSMRKTRSDKKTNVNPALDGETHRKLKRIALACDCTKTSLAAEIIEIALNSPSFINLLQDRHQAGEFRVIPLNNNGRIEY